MARSGDEGERHSDTNLTEMGATVDPAAASTPAAAASSSAPATGGAIPRAATSTAPAEQEALMEEVSLTSAEEGGVLLRTEDSQTVAGAKKKQKSKMKKIKPKAQFSLATSSDDSSPATSVQAPHETKNDYVKRHLYFHGLRFGWKKLPAAEAPDSCKLGKTLDGRLPSVNIFQPYIPGNRYIESYKHTRTYSKHV